MKLHLDDEELATCVSCGLCLPHCPTFRVTGEEALSPRGRIAAIRAVHLEDAPITPEFVSFMETCVQCRGCEPACPSGVHYGHLQEGVRESLVEQGRMTPWWQRWGFKVLPHHRTLLLGSSALAVAQRLRLVPKRAGLPRLALRRSPAVADTGTDAWLFTGCVMDAWLRDTHRSTAKVLDHLGVTYRTPGTGGGCCGALHTHAGLTDESRRLAVAVMASMPGDAPVVVNSAGCGAALKDYGHLLGTPDAEAFAARVQDVHEFVAQHIDRLAPTKHLGSVIVQDPCHLRHVQKAHMAVRTVLAPVADLKELDDDGVCCGAGGAYSVMQPALAGDIRARKVAAIGRAGEGVVASANPGCAMHLAAAGLVVRHPIDLLADAL
ncbi:MAG: 4Fe-4S dicluster domain-containing protein [Actinobacteria bacterium]|nr:4Fe-4S dicluster domain-containing protein [Actinomycetota bacterium]